MVPPVQLELGLVRHQAYAKSCGDAAHGLEIAGIGCKLARRIHRSSRLPDGLEELFKSRRGDHAKSADDFRTYAERVGYASRQKNGLSGPNFVYLSIHHDSELTLKDVKGLVLKLMDVIWRFSSRAHYIFDQREDASCIFSGEKNAHVYLTEGHRIR